LDKTIVLV